MFASHPLDLQNFSIGIPVTSADPFSPIAHVGPPGINVEAKITGLDDTAVEAGADPEGKLLLKGPPVGRLVGQAEPGPGEERWVETGERCRASKNGAFRVVSRSLA